MTETNRVAALRKGLDRWPPRWLSVTLLLVCLSSGTLTLAELVARIDRIGEAGFGDNYILHTTLQFQKTGVIYEPPETSKSVPAISQYSPMLYILLSLPGRLISWGNPFIGPRLIAITAFLLCVAVIAAITRTLVPHPWAWRWGVLLALSTDAMRGWILQIRGDFPGILFSLISIRLLLARSRWCVLLAGAAAGFATQFKFTYVSAIVAGSLWLALQRRWKGVAEFTGAAVAASLGIYLLFLRREPQMLGQMFALRHQIREFSGLFEALGYTILREPVVLLGAATLPLVALRRSSRWGLLIGYLAVSLVISTALNIQAGGNINYFFEALFAMVPLAAFGALQLGRCRLGTAGLFLCVLLLFRLAAPNAFFAYRSIRQGRRETATWNLRMNAIRNVFHGKHVLSSVPTATHLAPETVIDESYLLSYLERLGMIDLKPLRKRILDREFDLVVTMSEASAYRSVPILAQGLRPAIAEVYQPFCIYEGWLIHLPRKPARPGLPEQFTAIGCVPVTGVIDNAW